MCNSPRRSESHWHSRQSHYWALLLFERRSIVDLEFEKLSHPTPTQSNTHHLTRNSRDLVYVHRERSPSGSEHGKKSNREKSRELVKAGAANRAASNRRRKKRRRRNIHSNIPFLPTNKNYNHLYISIPQKERNCFFKETLDFLLYLTLIA